MRAIFDVIARDGQMDGIPISLMEAMAAGVPAAPGLGRRRPRRGERSGSFLRSLLLRRRLARRGFAAPRRDYVPYLERSLEARPDFPDEEPERSLWMGETGIRLVLQRLAPTQSNLGRLSSLIAANEQDERCELMWGSPGTILAGRELGLETLDLMGFPPDNVKLVLNRARSRVGISDEEVPDARPAAEDVTALAPGGWLVRRGDRHTHAALDDRRARPGRVSRRRPSGPRWCS